MEEGADEDELITDEEFADLTVAVNDAMTKVIRPMVTALSSSSDEHVRLEGSGTFVVIDEMCFIVTCAHVVNAGGVEFGFYGSNDVLSGAAGVLTADKIDCALIDIPEFIWGRNPHEARVVPFEIFAEKHDPAETELFFLSGFAGENSHYGFDNLEGTATCYTTQINKAADYDDRFFYLHWRPGKVRITPPTPPDVAQEAKAEDPHGLSGSLVWDTRVVQNWDGDQAWTPADARVTGVVTSWDQQSESLVCRRIEDVTAWMIDALRNGGAARESAAESEPSTEESPDA